MSEVKIFTHLQDYNFYNELYDQHTIEECQDWENKKHKLKDLSKLTEKERKLEKLKNKYLENVFFKQMVYLVKGERYADKSESIRKWMEEDRVKDEKLANAIEPRVVRCLNCSSLMTNCISRDLMSNHNSKKEEVLFMFECNKCGKRRAFWENGREWEYKSLCPKCNSELNRKTSRKNKIIATSYSCPKCDYKETDTYDPDKRKEDAIDPNFEANRKKYCLSDKEGMDYVSWRDAVKRLTDSWKDEEENKDVFEAMAKIKKLTIAELQTLLDPLIEKAGYAKPEFEKPDIQRDVILGFSLQDNKPGREEYDSIHDLTKIIKNYLEGTNWRLMSDGISYRLGFLTGRLRGVEGEENLKKLAKKTIHEKNKKKH